MLRWPGEPPHNFVKILAMPAWPGEPVRDSVKI